MLAVVVALLVLLWIYEANKIEITVRSFAWNYRRTAPSYKNWQEAVGDWDTLERVWAHFTSLRAVAICWINERGIVYVCVLIQTYTHSTLLVAGGWAVDQGVGRRK